MGAAPLSLEQKESMSVKQDYQISDFDLMETRDYQISDFDLMETREEKDQSTFGAVY
ncbi:MAG: hypothetical protein K2M43_02940 [Mycoplasmoidaceae bacterium]|nr:hypothetical protein [Mycoplasmoidaceae bacterium]